MEIKELLLESCSIMHNLSLHCTYDFVGHNSSVAPHTSNCNWYHSVWQYLRVLDCVSAPQWHQDFFVRNIRACSLRKKSVSILISGSADYSLLHLVFCAIADLGVTAEIDVVDLCYTPLSICKWYTENVIKNSSNKSTIQVSVYQSNITMFRADKKYDVICTDAFLTRFASSTTRSVVETWERLLAPTGWIITTVRIHPEECIVQPTIAALSKDIDIFLTKVRDRYSELTEEERKKMKISPEELSFMAFRYILHMKSNILGQRTDIERLFTDSGLYIDQSRSQLAAVVGEVKETDYYRVIAQKEY